jgi:RNA polymerase sigma-70 factor (ECF subfamily)
VRHNFLELYDKYFDDIYRYIYFKTGNKWDADDLVSEVFKKAYEKHGSIKSSPKAWLFSIARNTVIDFYRKRKDVAVGDDLDLYTYPLEFESEVEKEEELDILKKSLSRLSKDELEIINLKYFADMKYSEIGTLMNRTEDSVKMKCFRTVKKLKELINGFLEGL